MFKFATLLIAVGISLTSHASDAVVLAVPAMPSLNEPYVASYTPPVVEKSVSLDEAKQLDKNKELQYWTVLEVNSPACVKNNSKKECAQNKKLCKDSTAFAKKNGVVAICDELYTQASVRLTLKTK